MLTWKSGIVFKFDTLLNEVAQLSLPDGINEGWGLTHDETNLFISDGSSKIYRVDVDTFTVLDYITVKKQGGGKVINLNELEMVNNELIYANEW
mmetsp:Transcript_2426/g.2377  ORF Transcript_2426/g.2377 Transcript_2426/m.2377 type:complete len:94 (+) Transcript_2426:306-587(+)|eukprot:CAMPEP_0170563502 /NCGR_PEP_ID=MMETSP0211-20121228/67079_1 /TAXON_ID=311385 /ORGANISM="Pseudokeronopsis sp., Strain OXSARD2" /LENGTH=93 /DNA_ID=CAMNT_0010881823 /DNA_START=299 /DNA_END=580 /DNA_ORIENTATION=+